MSYQSAATRSRVVIALLCVWVASAIGLVVVNLLRLDLVNRVGSGQPVSLADATASDNLVSGAALASSGVYVLAAIAVLMWLHRVVRNNHILGERYLRFSAGFAVGCWFIPFANFVLPFQAVREAWSASDPELPWSTPDQRRRSRGRGLVVAWWSTFIVGSLVSFASLGFGPNSDVDVLTRVRAITYITVAEEALHLAAALLLIALVTRLTSRQDQKAQSMLAAALAQPTPPAYAAPSTVRPGFMPPGFAAHAGMSPPPPPPSPPPLPPPR